MTNERWTSGDAELTRALRALYAAPREEGYWEALEAHATHDFGGWSARLGQTQGGYLIAPRGQSFSLTPDAWVGEVLGIGDGPDGPHA